VSTLREKLHKGVVERLI